MRSSVLRAAVLLSVAISLLTASATFAYQGQVPANVTVTGPLGAISCGTSYELQATVFDQNGQPIVGQTVLWSVTSAPSGATDALSPATTTTDSNGVATTHIAFGTATGSRTIRATAGSAFSQAIVIVTTCAPGSGPSPSPSPSPTPTPTPPPGPATGRCTSALGLSTSGDLTTSTKISQFGRYITFELSFGAQYAGKTVIVAVATRQAPYTLPAVWSDFSGATGRIADANGNAFFHIRLRSTAWISVRGFILSSPGLGSSITLACQGRWR